MAICDVNGTVNGNLTINGSTGKMGVKHMRQMSQYNNKRENRRSGGRAGPMKNGQGEAVSILAVVVLLLVAMLLSAPFSSARKYENTGIEDGKYWSKELDAPVPHRLCAT